MKQGYAFSPLLLSTVLKVIEEYEKEMKGLQTEKKEIKLSLFSGNMILYLKDTDNHTSKVLELANIFTKVANSLRRN